MKITKITTQVKRSDRYSIFVDNTYAFSLSETALLEQQLVRGQDITKQQLKQLKQLSSDDKAYGRALRYAALRPRSRWEMENYLQRRDVEEHPAQLILNKLSNIGLLDDTAFAHAWVENRRLLKPTSRRRLVQELKLKRVSDEIINKVLDETKHDELHVLQELVAKKRQRSPYRDNDVKLMQYLARQGFNYHDITAVMHGSEH